MFAELITSNETYESSLEDLVFPMRILKNISKSEFGELIEKYVQ
jgi:hypothetical protein